MRGSRRRRVGRSNGRGVRGCQRGRVRWRERRSRRWTWCRGGGVRVCGRKGYRRRQRRRKRGRNGGSARWSCGQGPGRSVRCCSGRRAGWGRTRVQPSAPIGTRIPRTSDPCSATATALGVAKTLALAVASWIVVANVTQVAGTAPNRVGSRRNDQRQQYHRCAPAQESPPGKLRDCCRSGPPLTTRQMRLSQNCQAAARFVPAQPNKAPKLPAKSEPGRHQLPRHGRNPLKKVRGRENEIGFEPLQVKIFAA